ncbi:MAG: hypothetical protein ACRC46_02840 [Thermoguttaceae bacterium]
MHTKQVRGGHHLQPQRFIGDNFMRNVVLSSFTLEQFKPARFESALSAELLEYRSGNSHRAIVRLHGNGQSFTENELDVLRKDIKQNLSLSWGGNFAFALVLYDWSVTEDFHYQMVDDWGRRDGACLWSIVVDNRNMSATGIHYWQSGGMTNIFEDILRQHPQADGTVVNKYKTPPNVIRWLNAIQRPFSLRHPINRPWVPKPKFYPPF